MGGDPDVVGRNRTSLAPERGGDSAKTIRRDERNRKKSDVGVFEKLLQVPPIRLVMRTVAKPEKQLADDDRRHENVFCPADPLSNGFVSPKKRGIRVRIKQDPHFQRTSSTASQEAMLSRNRRPSAADQ